MKERSLGKVIADALGLPNDDAQRLQHFKNPTFQRPGTMTGDFPEVVFSVVKNLLRVESNLKVGELNQFLDELASNQNHQKQVEIMTKLLQLCSGEDMKWISRTILKDLKIGLKHERVLVLYHPEALDLYNITSNLREVCREFENIEARMDKRLFRVHFLPSAST